MDSPEDRQRFTRRLEAFSDIVFGFALAQSAVALEVPKNLADFGSHRTELVYFVITFVLIAQFWLIHYRIFHYVFLARTTDVVLNFLLLGTVALLPYALRIWIHFPETVIGGVAYALALGGGFTLVTVLELRGMRGLTGAMRQRWIGIVTRHGMAAAVFLISLVLFPLIGLSARYEWAMIGPGMVLAKRISRSTARVAGTAPSRSES
ncbi:MAG TPA: TMEM175 family protein [Xanthomonadales bacterium]|nr:TMEM175 family protein [Xanthomonadales bacterium]